MMGKWSFQLRYSFLICFDNNLGIYFQASFIAELSRDKWEEADFLNHTVFISPSNDCHYSRGDQDPIPWIIGKENIM